MRVGCLLLLLLGGTVTFARVGDSPEGLAQRFGSPSALILDSKGYGLGVYHADGFKEIRVTFAAGKSQHENYLLADEQAPRDVVMATLQKENPDQDVYDATSRGIQVGHGEPGSELKFATFSREQRGYTGILELKERDDLRHTVVRTGEAVLEIPYTEADLEFRGLKPGITATITMLDELPSDLDAPTGFVGRREHVDRSDALDDAHTRLQTLVKIEAGGDVLFDRTVCGVHQTQMQLSNVPVAYGLLISSKAERYCGDRFPHAKAFARGGCVVTPGSAEFTPVYQCPKCVAACAEYAASQPAVPEE